MLGWFANFETINSAGGIREERLNFGAYVIVWMCKIECISYKKRREPMEQGEINYSW